MTTNLIWILYRSDSDTAYKETLNCKKIIEGYGKKVLFSEISNETNNINQLYLKSEALREITIILGCCGKEIGAVRSICLKKISMLCVSVRRYGDLLTHDSRILN